MKQRLSAAFFVTLCQFARMEEERPMIFNGWEGD